MAACSAYLIACIIILSPQKTGYLMKKRFSTGGKDSPWQRRWFVLKDGFLFYYTKRCKSDQVFNNHPKGVIPLGGCSVSYVKGRNSRGELEDRAFEVKHPDFNGASLLLAAEDEAQAQQWVRQLEDCRRVTWENALLGDAKLKALRARGTLASAEAEAALAAAQEKARALGAERDRKLAELDGAELEARDATARRASIEHAKAETAARAEELARAKQAAIEEADKLDKEKRSIAQRHWKGLKKKQHLLTSAARALQDVEQQKEAAQAEFEAEHAAKEAAVREKNILQARLKEAEMSLKTLDKALRARKGNFESDEIHTSVSALKDFFAQKVEESRVRFYFYFHRQVYILPLPPPTFVPCVPDR